MMRENFAEVSSSTEKFLLHYSIVLLCSRAAAAPHLVFTSKRESGARRTKETWRSFEQSRSPVSPSGFNAGHHRIHRVSSKTNQITPATQYFV